MIEVVREDTLRGFVRVATIGLAAASAGGQPLSEQFDAIGTLPGAGWALVNNSSPVGAIGWFQGATQTFPPHATAGYIAADYRSVNLLGTISNWLVLPERSLNNGDTLQFWTRTVSPSVYADRLQVRLSTAGPSVNVGATATSVGDFATLLLDVNPDYQTGAGGYPESWTLFTVEVQGLNGPTQGRLALRYFVEHGGEVGSRSDCIGVDTLSFMPGGSSPGRCCLVATGACIVTTEFDCATQGGTFGGGGTSCQGFECPQPPAGACCLPTGGCQLLPGAACAIMGGVFRGVGTSCTGAGCPVAFTYTGGALSIPDGSGQNACGITVHADVFVPMSFPVHAAEVSLQINHQWQGDVTARLVKAGGPTITLIDRPGRPPLTYGFSSHSFGNPTTTPPRFFRLSDTAPTTYDSPFVAAPGIHGVSGTWRPEESFEGFAAVNSLGEWTLELQDCAGGESGELLAFTLLLYPPPGTTVCYPNCDNSTGEPLLTANDFQCFLNRFAAGDPRANCDGSLGSPMLTANDFGCFLNRFAAGCQ